MRSLKTAFVALMCLAALAGVIALSGSTALAGPAQVMDPGHAKPGSKKSGPSAAAGADCAACHSCPAPTHTNPCLRECQRHGAQFKGKHGADEGPEIVIIDQLANLYGPVVFAHKLHAEMSDMTGGCTNCHHYSPPEGPVPPCRQCHEPTRAASDLRQPALKGAYHRQCINCHLDWSHENACGFCHEQATGRKDAGPKPQAGHDPTDIVGARHPLIKAQPTYTYKTTEPTGPLVTFHHEDHVEKFGLRCVDCHRGDTCASCHDTGGTKQKRTLDHVVTCGACHAERNCAFCHSHDSKPQFDHRLSTGWSLEPYHRKVACTTCHGEPQAFRKPSRRCTECHIHWAEGSFDHAVTGLRLDETHRELECANCHVGMDVTATPQCTDCHDEAMLPARLPGSRVSRR